MNSEWTKLIFSLGFIIGYLLRPRFMDIPEILSMKKDHLVQHPCMFSTYLCLLHLSMFGPYPSKPFQSMYLSSSILILPISVTSSDIDYLCTFLYEIIGPQVPFKSSPFTLKLCPLVIDSPDLGKRLWQSIRSMPTVILETFTKSPLRLLYSREKKLRPSIPGTFSVNIFFTHYA